MRAYYTPKGRNWRLYQNHSADTSGVAWVRIEALGGLELPRPIVLVNGCFDILHSGHMKLFAIARKYAEGGSVVAAVDSDERVRAMKGPGRPILSFIERATALEYMPIDALVEFTSDKEFAAIIEALRPNLRVQGTDHAGDAGLWPTLQHVYVPYRGVSTTNLIARCKAS